MTKLTRFFVITTASLMGLAVLVYAWLSPSSELECAIFSGGPIVTMDNAAPSPAALVIRGGRIASFNTEDGAGCDEIDLAGRTLMPGLIEPHTHPIASALLSQTLDVSGFAHENRASIMAALKDAAASGDGPIMAFGWDPVMLDDLEAPTLAELDAIAPNRPLLILTQMMHDAYANSAALTSAGITRDTPNPEGGEFVRDENGDLTGTVREVSAITALMGATPKAPEGAMAVLLNLQYANYAKAGYTTIGALGPSGNVDDPLAMMRAVAEMPAPLLRTVVYALPDQLAQGDWKPGAQSSNESFTLRGVKFWMDGSPFAGGAAFAEPYEDTPLTRERLHLKPPHVGAMNYSEQDFEAEFRRYHNQGFRIAIHVQGERAVDRVLDVAAEVLADHPRTDHRHRLEHNALITAAQMARAKELGFTLSFFVDHIYFYGHALPQLVGAERTHRYMPLGEAARQGHVVTFHTDNPATPIAPFRALHTALTRQPRNGGAPINMENALNRMEGLRAFTINAAWQLGLENEVGSLTPGKRADLVILSANPTTVPVAELPEINAVETWLDGRRTDTRPTSLTNAKLTLAVLGHLLLTRD